MIVWTLASHPAHGRFEALGEFAERAEVLLEALQLCRRGGRRGALLRRHLLLPPHVSARHQQQITQQQLHQLQHRQTEQIRQSLPFRNKSLEILYFECTNTITQQKQQFHERLYK